MHKFLLPAVAIVALAGCSGNPPREVVTAISIPDASGDVVVGGLHHGRTAVVAAAPRNATADILNTTVEHGAEAITVEVVFRDLRSRQYLDLTALVTTDSTGSGVPVQASALTYRGDRRVDLYHASAPRCPRAAVAIDFEADALTMTLPRTCLGEPRWIEAEVTAQTMRYDAAPDDPHAGAVWEDDAYRTGVAGSGGAGASRRLYHPGG